MFGVFSQAKSSHFNSDWHFCVWVKDSPIQISQRVQVQLSTLNVFNEIRFDTKSKKFKSTV